MSLLDKVLGLRDGESRRLDESAREKGFRDWATWKQYHKWSEEFFKAAKREEANDA